MGPQEVCHIGLQPLVSEHWGRMEGRIPKLLLPCNLWETGFHRPRLYSLDASDNIHLGHSKREVSFVPGGHLAKNWKWFQEVFVYRMGTTCLALYGRQYFTSALYDKCLVITQEAGRNTQDLPRPSRSWSLPFLTIILFTAQWARFSCGHAW